MLLKLRELRNAESVSVPFNAGRGLMLKNLDKRLTRLESFSTLQCGSWIDAPGAARPPARPASFQYPSMRVVD